MSLPKILLLHGSHQNKQIFYKKSGGLRKFLKNKAELVYVSSPHEFPEDHEAMQKLRESPKEGDSNSEGEEVESLRYWFNRTKDNKYPEFAETIDYFNNLFDEQGPFDAIIGFSQGAVFASILITLLEQKHPLMKSTKQGAFKFSALFSGFFPLDTDIQALFQLPVNTPSIHVWGTQDIEVIPERSEVLSQKFNNPEIVKHDAGHLIPTKSEFRKPVANFIHAELEKLANNNTHANL